MLDADDIKYSFVVNSYLFLQKEKGCIGLYSSYTVKRSIVWLSVASKLFWSRCSSNLDNSIIGK